MSNIRLSIDVLLKLTDMNVTIEKKQFVFFLERLILSYIQLQIRRFYAL